MPEKPAPVFQSRFFRVMLGIILVLAALYLLKQVDYLLKPVVELLGLLITPVLISVFLYYILRPLVRWLTGRLRLPASLAVLLTFLLILVLIAATGLLTGNVIQEQFKDLTERFANYYQAIQDNLRNLGRGRFVSGLLARLNLEEKIGSMAGGVFPAVQRNLVGFFSTVTNIGTIMVLIPFILFYFLLDDRRIAAALRNLCPIHYRARAAEIMRNADTTLARYIQGQLMIALIIGVLTFLGYLLIGLPNSFILAVITMITSFIPIFGAFLGAVPAALIGLAVNPWFMLKVLIVLVVVQQLEGNLISPRLQGARMNIHPLMVLFVVITAYALFGVLGSLFAVPAYVVLRVLAKMFWAEKWLACGEK